MSLKQPVQYPVKYYSYTDTDAPQLADADGVIKTILKACLVTGYGDGADAKEGAGWTALFEDDYRIILRRPLGTGSPPDIKIENGVIDGAASHRIVSQDDPTGLDDPTELAASNLLARSNSYKQEWHLIVSDFGFLLCYQVAEPGYPKGEKNSMRYVGSTKKMQDSAADMFITNEDSKYNKNGTGGIFLSNFLDENHGFVDMRTGAKHNDKTFITLGDNLSELHFNNDYIAQNIIVNNRVLLPFYCSLLPKYSDLSTKTVSISGRPMLRYVQQVYMPANARPFYIPLDYWEL